MIVAQASGDDFGAAPRVVLVDDDPAVRSALAFALGTAGYAVETFADGETVLRLRPAADCYIIDDRLGDGMSGIELLLRLRAGRAATPVILITTNPTAEVKRRAAGLGVPIVEKPLLGAQLDATLARLIARG